MEWFVNCSIEEERGNIWQRNSNIGICRNILMQNLFFKHLGNEKLTSLLLENGALINQRTNEGRTALDMAAWNSMTFFEYIQSIVRWF